MVAHFLVERKKTNGFFTRKVMRKIFRIFPCLSIYCGLAHHFNSNCMKLIEAVYGCVVLPVPHGFFSSFPYNSPFPSRTRIVSPVTDCVITKGYSRVLPDSETVTMIPVSARVMDHVGSSPDPEKFDPCVWATTSSLPDPIVGYGFWSTHPGDVTDESENVHDWRKSPRKRGRKRKERCI